MEEQFSPVQLCALQCGLGLLLTRLHEKQPCSPELIVRALDALAKGEIMNQQLKQKGNTTPAESSIVELIEKLGKMMPEVEHG